MSERNQNQALQAALAAADENMRQSSRKRKGLMAALIAGVLLLAGAAALYILVLRPGSLLKIGKGSAGTGLL